MAKKEVKSSKDKRHFFKDFKAELKKVIWPTPKQLVNNTIAVITIVLITAAIVFILDLAFESINKYGINKLKDVIGNTTENTVQNETSNETENQTSEEENNSESDTTNESEDNRNESNTANNENEQNNAQSNNEVNSAE